MKTPAISRRHALFTAAALPFVPGLAGMAHAAAEMKGASTPQFNRFKLGGFEVTALLAGTRTVEKTNRNLWSWHRSSGI